MGVYARVENGVVVEILKTEEAAKVLFHPDFVAALVDIESTSPHPDVGWTYAKKRFTAPDLVFPESVVPAVVTIMQVRLAMLNAGILDEVETAVAAMAGDEGKAAQIQWRYGAEVWRDRPLVAALQKAVGLTDDQIDEIFIAAAAI